MTNVDMETDGDPGMDQGPPDVEDGKTNADDPTRKNLMQLHHIEFFDFVPRPVNCLAYDGLSKKMAISRFDGENSYIELWNTKDTWFPEQNLSPYPSVEAMLWYKSRLFCAGLTGELVEFDLVTGNVKSATPSNFGPIWCMALNKKEGIIAAGTEEGTIVFYEILETEVAYKSAFARQGKIFSICWHEELGLIVTGGTDVRVWDVRTGSLVQKVSVSANKDTKVWAVAVTDDFTMVTGDSTGHTSFWFGKPGHLSHCKRFLSHESDIHAIEVNDKGDTICVAGVDGVVTFVTSKEALIDTDLTDMSVAALDPLLEDKVWVNRKKTTHHVNDVNAIQFIDSTTVVSAGLDCQTIVCDLKNKKLKKISYIQQKGLVHSARKAKCLLFQYPKSLELWMLGEPQLPNGVPGEVLSLERPEKRLLNMNSTNPIISSCISSNAKIITFSTEVRTSLYRIHIGETDSDNTLPSVKATLMNCPPKFAQTPSTHLLISPNGTVLVSVSKAKKLTFLDLKTQWKKSKTVAPLSKYKMPGISIIQDLSFNCHSSLLAIACSVHGMTVVNVVTGELVIRLQDKESPVYSIDFHPVSHERLLLSHVDATITEVSVKSNGYTKKSKRWMANCHNQFTHHLSLNKLSSRFKVSYDYSTAKHSSSGKSHGDKIICQHDTGFSVVDWTKGLENQPLKRKRDEGREGSKVVKFIPTKNLFHVEVMDETTMVVVEKCTLDFMGAFAPTFRKHKFGT